MTRLEKIPKDQVFAGPVSAATAARMSLNADIHFQTLVPVPRRRAQDSSSSQAAQIVAGLSVRVADHQVFWLDDDFTELVNIAAQSLPDSMDLGTVEIPCPSADIVLATARPDSGVPVRLIRWQDCSTPAAMKIHAASLAFLVDIKMAGLVNVVDLEHPRGAVVEIGSEQSWAPQFLLAFFLLLSQPGVTDTAMVQPPSIPDMSQARKGKKRKRVRQPAVRVVTLRPGSEHSAGDGHGDREYRHRWMVRGHWRMQPYRSTGAVRPVWIAPYLKGPDGAPLLDSLKVIAVRGQ